LAETKVERTAPTVLFELDGEQIKLDPHRPGRAYARLVRHERPLWALTGDLRGNGWNIVQTAHDYDLPVSAMRAVVAYYQSEPQFIDALLLLNDDAFESFGSA